MSRVGKFNLRGRLSPKGVLCEHVREISSCRVKVDSNSNWQNQNDATTIHSLRFRIPANLQPTFDAISHAIGLRSNPVGLITCINQLIQDLNAAGPSKFGLEEWAKILQELRSSLLDIGLDINADQLMIRSLRSEKLSAFENIFHPTASPDDKNNLKAIRGLIVLSIISNHRALGNKLGKSIRKVFRDEVGGFAKIRNSLALQQEALKSLRTTFLPGSSEARFLTEIIKGLTSHVHVPPKSEKNTHGVVVARAKPEAEKDAQESPASIQAKPRVPFHSMARESSMVEQTG